MNIPSRSNLNLARPLALASVLWLAISAAQAGTVPPSARDAAQPSPPREQAPRDQAQPREQGAQDNPAPSRQQGPPRGNGQQGNAGRGNGNGNGGGYSGGNGGRNDSRGDSRGDDRRVDRGYNRPPSGNWSTSDGRRDYRPRPPRRYVPSLPYGHARHNWNGRPYYYYGGSWYRPYGAQFAIVSAPFGLFVNTLPSYHSSLWYGGSRYFYADDTYYQYEPVRRGYVVTRSPYGDDKSDDYDDADEELFIYPARGQSEQQQADDKYECHRWAADQTNYDPVESDYDAGEREEYQRAMTACLTGRGYSVK